MSIETKAKQKKKNKTLRWNMAHSAGEILQQAAHRSYTTCCICFTDSYYACGLWPSMCSILIFHLLFQLMYDQATDGCSVNVCAGVCMCAHTWERQREREIWRRRAEAKPLQCIDPQWVVPPPALHSTSPSTGRTPRWAIFNLASPGGSLRMLKVGSKLSCPQL